MKRFFRLEDAERLLPDVRVGIEEARRLRSEHEHAAASLQREIARISTLGGAIVDRDRIAGERIRRDESAAALHAEVERIHSLGCQIKDLDIGLVDFPTRFKGQEVLLCWKMGEPNIAWWHGLEEGFRGRKRIDEDFIANHEGDLLS
jgi:hypothetical protein